MRHFHLGAFEKSAARFKGDQVFRGDTGDLGEGVGREKSLVRGHEDVGETDEAGEIVVLQDIVGEVLKKDTLFDLVDIESNPAGLFRLQ